MNLGLFSIIACSAIAIMAVAMILYAMSGNNDESRAILSEMIRLRLKMAWLDIRLPFSLLFWFNLHVVIFAYLAIMATLGKINDISKDKYVLLTERPWPRALGLFFLSVELLLLVALVIRVYHVVLIRFF